MRGTLMAVGFFCQGEMMLREATRYVMRRKKKEEKDIQKIRKNKRKLKRKNQSEGQRHQDNKEQDKEQDKKNVVSAKLTRTCLFMTANLQVSRYIYLYTYTDRN